MVETTVEVERTVTEEETLTLCEECQREVDENGDAFVPLQEVVDSLDNQGISARADVEEKLLKDWLQLHFCSECLREMTDGSVRPSYIERAEEWLDHDNMYNGVRSTVRSSVEQADEAASFFFKGGAILGFVIAIVGAAPVSIPAMQIAALYGVGGFCALALVHHNMRHAIAAMNSAEEEIEE